MHKALHSTIHDCEIFDSPQAQTVISHVAIQNIPVLRKFVEARSPQPTAKPLLRTA
jgi:hypothetical protein